MIHTEPAEGTWTKALQSFCCQIGVSSDVQSFLMGGVGGGGVGGGCGAVGRPMWGGWNCWAIFLAVFLMLYVGVGGRGLDARGRFGFRSLPSCILLVAFSGVLLVVSILGMDCQLKAVLQS